MNIKTSKVFDFVVLIIVLVLAFLAFRIISQGKLCFNMESVVMMQKEEVQDKIVEEDNKVVVKPLSQCLPNNIKLSTLISKTTNVGQKLASLNAKCTDTNKLMDGNGKEIYFYSLTGCWGNAPVNYRDILDKQQDEITNLNKKYNVVEISCNTSGALIP